MTISVAMSHRRDHLETLEVKYDGNLAESAGKLCQNLSLAFDQEKSQIFEAKQSIEIS